MEDTILALEQQAMERWQQGDPGGFVDLSADEIIYVDPSLASPLLGREAFTASMRRPEGKIHYQRSEFIEPKVAAAGDAAVLSYNYRSSVIAPEGALLSQTPWNATEVYFRQEGQWRIAHAHWSYLQHQLPASLEVRCRCRCRRGNTRGFCAR